MGDRWGNLTRERVVLLVMALFGLGYLLLGSSGEPTRMSLWRGAQASVAQVGSKADIVGQQSLVAVTGMTGRGLGEVNYPLGNPLKAANTVMTQGYGVGSHAPAETWGAIDLALDGNGDGVADPDGTLNQPVYATHSGVVKTTPNSWPAGNHIWVSNDEYRTGYSHLANFAVSDGQTVQRGDLIGYIGSTGMSSGPHLDYQVWKNEQGNWVNVNPLDFDALGEPK